MIRVKEEIIGKGLVRLISECEECNSLHVIIVPIDELVEFKTSSKPIQDIFPNMLPSDRELHFQSGVCSKCWNIMDYGSIEEIGITDLEKFPNGVADLREKAPLITTCKSCGEEIITSLVSMDHYMEWREIQESPGTYSYYSVFPELTQEEIETHFVNGICKSCWDKHYSEE